CVIEHGQRDIARLDADKHFDVVVLQKLLGLLQADLRIELIVFLDELDLTSSDGPADAVEIEAHAVKIVFRRISNRPGEGIYEAEADGRAGLREQRWRAYRRSQDCAGFGGAHEQFSTRNSSQCCCQVLLPSFWSRSGTILPFPQTHDPAMERFRSGP